MTISPAARRRRKRGSITRTLVKEGRDHNFKRTTPLENTSQIPPTVQRLGNFFRQIRTVFGNRIIVGTIIAKVCVSSYFSKVILKAAQFQDLNGNNDTLSVIMERLRFNEILKYTRSSQENSADLEGYIIDDSDVEVAGIVLSISCAFLMLMGKIQ